MILNNKMNYNKPFQNNMKTVNASKIAFTGDTTGETPVKDQNKLNNLAPKLSFSGFISRTFGNVMESTMSPEVKDALDFIA